MRGKRAKQLKRIAQRLDLTPGQYRRMKKDWVKDNKKEEKK